MKLLELHPRPYTGKSVQSWDVSHLPESDIQKLSDNLYLEYDFRHWIVILVTS
jgi:hypothetical protein